MQSLESDARYYHLWVGFDDGSFLGYYNKGAFDLANPDLFAISYMSSGNQDCLTAYNVTAPCREYFEADPATGARRRSFDGQTYDCRGRGWYSDTASTNQAQWTAMYVDKSTNQPAFAFCAPLSDLTTSPSVVSPDLVFTGTSDNPIIGVACSGMYITDISKQLRASANVMNFKGVVYVREVGARDGEEPLVASSSTDSASYYNATARSRLPSTESPEALIQWSSEQLAAEGAAVDRTVVKWANESRSSSAFLADGSVLHQSGGLRAARPPVAGRRRATSGLPCWVSRQHRIGGGVCGLRDGGPRDAPASHLPDHRPRLRGAAIHVAGAVPVLLLPRVRGRLVVAGS